MRGKKAWEVERMQVRGRGMEETRVPDPSQKMQNPIQGGGRRGTGQRELCGCDRGVCV